MFKVNTEFLDVVVVRGALGQQSGLGRPDHRWPNALGSLQP